MERRQAWDVIRSLWEEKSRFVAIKGIAARGALDLPSMAYLEQTSGAPSTSKSQMLTVIEAIDFQTYENIASLNKNPEINE